MKIHHFHQKQFINADIDTVWNFFSSPKNLNRITPPDMNFEILDIGASDEAHQGQIINYKVSPFPFLRVKWTTEITDVDPQRFFADNQKKGPFALWHHQHLFSSVSGGVEMTDNVSYSIPLGWIGILVNRLVVQHRVRRIFDYRREQIELIFPRTKKHGTSHIS